MVGFVSIKQNLEVDNRTNNMKGSMGHLFSCMKILHKVCYVVQIIYVYVSLTASALASSLLLRSPISVSTAMKSNSPSTSSFLCDGLGPYKIFYHMRVTHKVSISRNFIPNLNFHCTGI